MPRTQPAGGAGTRRRHLRLVDAETVRTAAEAAQEQAREQALALLTARPRTRAELVIALARKGVDPDVADEVLDRLAAVGLVDDEAYARIFAEREAGRKAPRAVMHALQRRGIAADLARAVAFAAPPEQARAAALELARTALPRWRGLDRQVVERRLAGLLARRGYGHEVVLSVVRELLRDDG